MKFFHLADLHLGKRVNEFSMQEDQEYILNKIIDAIDERKPDGLLLAGDIYDKTLPSAEAVTLFDDFLYRLVKRKLKVFIISGNHDSAERLAFASRIIKQDDVFISPVFSNQIEKISLRDAYGNLNLYLLPFIKPLYVKKIFPDLEIKTYDDAVRTVINQLSINKDERNIILAHQFVTGAETSESEEIFVGGSENISADIFSAFDYVALGHLHRPQSIKQENIRYSGSPLKYSFSEAGDQKSITEVTLKAKHQPLTIELLPLKARRDLLILKGSYHQLMEKSYYDQLNRDDYYQIILTDEEDIPNALNRLRVIYPNIMHLSYDNSRTRSNNEIEAMDKIEKRSPIELVNNFYYLQNNQELSAEQRQFVEARIERIWGE